MRDGHLQIIRSCDSCEVRVLKRSDLVVQMHTTIRFVKTLLVEHSRQLGIFRPFQTDSYGDQLTRTIVGSNLSGLKLSYYKHHSLTDAFMTPFELYIYPATEYVIRHSHSRSVRIHLRNVSPFLLRSLRYLMSLYSVVIAFSTSMNVVVIDS